MRRGMFLCFFVALALSAGAGSWGGAGGAESGDPALVVKATLKAVPDVYEGFCPTTIKFEGLIEVNEPCTLKYKFLRSDGATAPVQTLKILKPGKYPVNTTWMLGKTYAGWQAVEVLSPVSVKSNNADFSVKCLPRPKITGANQKHFGQPNPELDITGTDFGDVQGARNVQVDGTLITALPGWSVIRWKNTMITLQAANLIPWEHVYQIAVTEGSTVISNVLSNRFLYKFDGLTPKSGLPGSKIKIYIWSIPASPGGLVLKLGTHNFTILSWVPGKAVEARVPSAPPGTYKVFLQKGTQVVSAKTSFTVTKLLPKPATIKK